MIYTKGDFVRGTSKAPSAYFYVIRPADTYGTAGCWLFGFVVVVRVTCYC